MSCCMMTATNTAKNANPLRITAAHFWSDQAASLQKYFTLSFRKKYIHIKQNYEGNITL